MSRYDQKAKLQKKRDEALAKAQGIVQRAKSERGEDMTLTRDERRRFDRNMERVEKLNEDIKDLPAREPVARGAFDGDERRSNKGDGMENDERRAVDRYIRTGVIPDELRAETRAGDQSIGAASEGGVLASTGFSAELFTVLQQHGGLEETRALMIDTDHGRAFNRPGVDDVANKASIVGEGSTIAGTTNLTFFDVQFGALTYQAGPITLTHEQIQDSELDVVDIVRDKLGERIARGVNDDWAGSTVTSSTAPNGLVSVSTGAVTVTQGSSNLTLQALRDLHFSVDPAWRSNAEFAMSDAAFQAVADLEDADGRPIVEPNVQGDFAASLWGKPIRIVQELDDLASSSNFPIFFGDLGTFGIRRVRDVRIQRLDEKFALNRRVGFMAWFRTDSKALFSSTISSSNKPIRALKTTS